MKLLKNVLPVIAMLLFVTGCSEKDKPVSVLPQNIGLMQQTVKALDNIPLNYRVFPIKIDEATANAVRTCAICTPKYKADILTMLDIKLKDGQRKKAVATVLQDVKYNSHFEINGQNYLALLLTPVEAQYMSLLVRNPVKIILRSFDDSKLRPLETIDEKSFAERKDRASTPNKEYLLKISAETARNIEDGDIVNIKIKGDDKPVVKSVKILQSFSLNGDSFVSFNLTPIEAQYLFFAEAGKKKIYLSKSLNKEILEWISPAQENVKAALALAEEKGAREGLLEKAKATVSKPTEILDKGENTVTKEARQISSIERFKIGLRYYDQEDYNKAKEEWDAALELDPDNTDVFFGLKRIEARTVLLHN